MARETTCGSLPSQNVTSSELCSLQILHAGMTDPLAAAFSNLVRCPVDVSVPTVDQVPYGKLLRNLPSPSYFAVLKAEPLGDCLMLDAELTILYPMLDRMLGGGHEKQPPPRRSLSDVELPLAGRITRLFLETLAQTWRTVLPLKCEVLQVESRPQHLRVLPSEEMVALVAFAVAIGDQCGMIRLCLPCRAICRIADKLAVAQRQASSPTVSSGSAAGTDIAESRADVLVTLAASPISAHDLRGLRVGDIIATDLDVDSPAVVSIDGKPAFQARPGTCHGRRAVVLADMIDDRPPQTEI
jgi:flagellar motor switch protein FliM